MRIMRAALAGVLILATSAGLAEAGERHHQQHNFYANSDMSRIPVHVRGVGTYSGVVTYQSRGNGIYVSSQSYPAFYFWRETRWQAPKAKIITVTPATIRSACAWSHGICVIRN